ncbi:LuxR C-terminal-related transcriptional regulator [Streptomyces sp. NPDC002285]
MTRLMRRLTRPSPYSGVLLAGPTGVGKTRLASDALDTLSSTRQVIKVMSTWPDCERPDSCGCVAGGICRAQPVREVFNSLHAAPQSGRGAIIFIDDVHLLDPATSAMVLDLAEQQAVLLLITLNTDEAAPAAVTMLWKDNHVHRMEIGPLNSGDSRRLAGELTGHKLDRSAAVYLARLSDGNPLLLRELIRNAQQQQLFTPSPSGWTIPNELPLSIPLYELITRKVTGLTGNCRTALERIALAESIALPRLESLASAVTLLDLEERDLVRVVTSSLDNTQTSAHVQVAHPLIGHAIRQAMPVLRRRDHLRALLEVYPHRDQCSGLEAMTVTGWRLETGTPVSEIELLQTAHYATAAHDLAAAARFTAAAWEKYPSVRTAAEYALALIALADFPAATTVLNEAGAVFTDSHNRLAEVRARGYLMQGHFEDADPAISRLSGDGYRLHASMSDYFQGRFKSAIHLSGLLVDAFPSPYHQEAVIVQAAVLQHIGRPRDALALLDRLAPPLKEHGRGPCSLAEVRAAALAALGKLEEATDILTRAHRHAVGERLVRVDAQNGLALGSVLLERGRPVQALDLLTFHPAYQVGWPQWHDKARILRAMASIMTGRIIDDELPAGIPSNFLIYRQIVQAWSCFLSGDSRSAASILVSAMKDGQDYGAHTHVAMAVHELARIGLAGKTMPYLDTPVQGPYLQARLDYARALVTDDIRLLRNVAESFTQANADLFAAEAYAELSRLYRRSSRDRAGTAAALRARELAGRCEGVSTPALLSLSTTQPLTMRERDIIVLVSQGLTDKQIAERLTLSVRTVSNHLYRIYRKIGVDSRRALQIHAVNYHL